jgi:hypothetical protein
VHAQVHSLGRRVGSKCWQVKLYRAKQYESLLWTQKKSAKVSSANLLQWKNSFFYFWLNLKLDLKICSLIFFPIKNSIRPPINLSDWFNSISLLSVLISFSFNQTNQLCINTHRCNKKNQYWTGLECVSYSVTLVKSQLHGTNALGKVKNLTK